MTPLRISVVVPSHDRPIRLRWLLNALEEQTLPRERWELVVVHDSDDATESVLRTHPLARGGTVRHLRLPPGTGTPARQRNLGWRAARAPLVAFTDDDCRPAPGWLERLLAAAEASPGGIVQGRTKPDPHEAEIIEWAPRARSMDVDPPSPHAQTCNILYPRELLERLGGFDESFPYPAGEDWDLAVRGRKAGARHVGEPGALVHHAVHTFSLPAAMRFNRRWQSLALVWKRHPEERRVLVYGLFWKRRHLLLLAAAAGVAHAPRRPALALLGAPYVRHALPPRARGQAGVATAPLELVGRVLVDASEIWAMARGSIRHRTLVL